MKADKSPRTRLVDATYIAKIDDVPFVNAYEIGAVGQDFLKQADTFGRENNLATLEIDTGIISISNEKENRYKVS